MKLVKSVMALALAVAFGLGPQTASAQRQTFRIAHAAAENEWHAKAWQVFADQVSAALPERFKFELYPAGSLYRQGDQVAALARGNLEGGHMSANLVAEQIRSASVLTAGYLFRDPAHLCAYWSDQASAKLVEEVATRMGIRLLSAGYLGTRHLSLRRAKEVRTPTDLAGIRLRMPNSRTWLFLGSALGANPTPLAVGELYLALRTGTVDAQDNPIPSLVANNWHEVTEQIVLTGHLVDGILFAVSERLWRSLSAREQAVLREAAEAAADFNTKNRIAEEAELAVKLKSAGVQITTPDVDTFRRTVQAAYASSEFAATWEPGVLDKINAVVPQGRCAGF
jgi:TRAP-type C4-dicarboxylate transport system substrate-binding protein